MKEEFEDRELEICDLCGLQQSNLRNDECSVVGVQEIGQVVY